MTFPTGGFVQGCTSNLGGLVFLERAIYQFAKDQVKIVDTATVQEEQGTPSPYSIVQHETDAYFYGTDGFCAIGSGGVRQIGNEWVDNWFTENCNQGRLKTIIGALDPTRMRAYWAFPDSTNSASYTRNSIIMFDILNQEKPWSKAAIETEFIFGTATAGATLADLTTLYSTLGGVPYPLGSDAWLGGAARLGAFDNGHQLAFFSGNGVAATVQTAEFMPIPGQRFYINGFRIVGDATAATGRVAVKERPQNTETWKASASLTAQGFIPQRASGKTLIEEVSVPAGESWNFLAGIEHADGDIKPDGVR
jgi:hypothetical protein